MSSKSFNDAFRRAIRREPEPDRTPPPQRAKPTAPPSIDAGAGTTGQPVRAKPTMNDLIQRRLATERDNLCPIPHACSNSRSPALTRAEKKEHPTMAKQKTPPVTPVTTVTETPRPPCACGCGETPAGKRSRYRPGHDAKLLSRERAERFAWQEGDVKLTPPSLEPRARANAQDRPSGPARRRKGKDGTAPAAGSEE